MPRFPLLLVLLLTAACQSSPPSDAATVPVVAASFSGDASCASCHESETASYASHGMANSFHAMVPERVIEEFDGVAVYHGETDLYYRALREGDRFYQEEYRLDEAGNRTHELTREITHVVGSAKAARTYVSEQNGRYAELPLSWYAQAGVWDFSPGYSAANQRFDRTLTSRCMACHTDAPPVVIGTDDVFESAPKAISCERCHGAGSAHVAARIAVPEPEGESDPTILNPANLEIGPRLDVCQQCHLNGAVVMYPDGQDPYSFRPGDTLTDHQVMYAPAHESGLSVVSHADRLKRSACFLETIDSARPLECTTCHDPHEGYREKGPDYFNATCQSCHAGIAESVAPAIQADHTANANCVDCHMAKRDTEAPHSTFTDHFIRASIPSEAPIEAEQEEGGVVLERLSGVGTEAELAAAYLTYGYVRGDREVISRGLILADRNRDAFLDPANSNAAVLFGKALLVSGRPAEAVEPLRMAAAADTTDVERLLAIARALMDTGDFGEAEQFYLTALEKGPRNVNAMSDFGNFLLRQGRASEAAEQYRNAVAEDPSDAAAHNGLAAALSNLGQYEDALIPAQAAVDLRPDYVDAMTNLGTLRARVGDLEGAMEVLRPAALLGRDEGNASPILNAGLVAMQSGLWDEAIQMLGFLVTSNPNHAEMRVLLARAMIGKGDPISALAQVNAGLKANPDHEGALALKAELEAGK
jgi:Flp pilus assembly protein TadD